MQVLYDPRWLLYHQLLDVFWHNIDPTVPNRQFCVTGAQYRAAIFYHNETQKHPAEASKQALAGSQRFTDGSTLRLLLEPMLPTPTVWVFGGGHIVSPLVRAATLAGFRVRVIDDDPAFANQERFPEADATLVMPFAHVGERCDFGQDDYVVLMTRGHADDHTILEQIYACPARYLGMLGSKPRIAKIWQSLEARGMARQWLDRVHAPIGLNIHARSPEEIGISILAELIHVRRTSPVVIPQRQRRSS